MFTKNDFTQIGKILKTHSLSGECASSLSIELDDIDPKEPLFLFLDIDDCLIPFRVESYRYKTLDNVFLSFVGVDTKDRASELVSKTIWIENKHLPEDFNDIFDMSMLVGFEIYHSISSDFIGHITNIDTSTINTVAEVKTNKDDTLLIPLAQELISSIDIEDKKIYYDTPKGLF